MKKSIIFSLLILASAFMACEPIVNSNDIGGAITADQLDIKATPVVVNGKNSNKIVLTNSSPVLSSWDYGLKVSQKQSDTILLVVPGIATITFTGLNPDGTKITKDLQVTVDELTFPVAAQWGYLCGSGQKTWVWDETATSCFGNGGYLGNNSPGWWALKVGELDEQAAGEGEGASMIFSTSGASLTKNYTNGTAAKKGKFDFDMSKTTADGNGATWAQGVLTTSNVTVLCGISINEGKINVNTYDILSLDNDKMTLSYHASGTGSWGEAWFWLFRKAD